MRTVTLTIDGVTFNVAPTPMPKLMRAIAKMNAHGPESPEASEAMIEAVFWGARRAGAQVTLDWLQDNVDVHSIEQLATAFCEVNELEQRSAAPGEVGAPSAG